MSATASSIKLSAPAVSSFWEIAVLYADEHLLALEKPVGLPLLPGELAEDQPALLPLLHQAIRDRKPWVDALQIAFLGNAHPLEAAAGGVTLFARSKETLVRLKDLFGAEKPTLTMTALVQGAPGAAEFTSQGPITAEPDSSGRYHVNPRKGKKSHTLFKTGERLGEYTIVDCTPLTHRPHQARVHLAKLRLPIAGDKLYGGSPVLLSRIKPGFHLKPGHAEKPLLNRPAIHVTRLELAHPVTGEQLSICSPLPRDFEATLEYLRRFRRS